MREDNIATLTETLFILNEGAYSVNGRIILLQLSPERMAASHVLLPDNVRDVCGREPRKAPQVGKCMIDCVKMDSYEAAVSMTQDRINSGAGEKPVLVLNFANPVNIGGGVYKGARAQEEDLCRRSSLLRSLESPHASRYYRYNRSFRTHMGTDAMIFSPEVEIFRDEHGELMDETAVAAVLTCAAPMISYGLEGMSEQVLLDAFRRAGITATQSTLPQDEPLTTADLFSLGLSGRPNSAQRRKQLLQALALPEHLSTSALLRVLNDFVPRDTFLQALEELEA